MHSLWKSWPQHSVRNRPPLDLDDGGPLLRLHGNDLLFAIGDRQMEQATGEAAPEEAWLVFPLGVALPSPTSR